MNKTLTNERIEELALLNLGYDQQVRLRDFARAIEREVLATQQPEPRDEVTEEDEIERLRAEVKRLNTIINSPQSGDFLRAVSTEAEHQRKRWGSSHDAGKAPSDWFWLVGYLAGKALQAHGAGNIEKAEHHIITTAAALENWHGQMFGRNDMRPGIDAARAGEAS